jgi:hemerythrin-like domain-containing protein
MIGRAFQQLVRYVESFADKSHRPPEWSEEDEEVYE